MSEHEVKPIDCTEWTIEGLLTVECDDCYAMEEYKEWTDAVDHAAFDAKASKAFSDAGFVHVVHDDGTKETLCRDCLATFELKTETSHD